MRFFVFLLPVALLAQTPASPPKPGSVEGTVINSVTGAPIRKCTVTLERERYRYITATDDQGRFAVPQVEPGAGYRAASNCAGFQMPDQSRQEPLAVAAEQRVADVVIKAVPLAAKSSIRMVSL